MNNDYIIKNIENVRAIKIKRREEDEGYFYIGVEFDSGDFGGVVSEVGVTFNHKTDDSLLKCIRIVLNTAINVSSAGGLETIINQMDIGDEDD